MKLTSNYLTLNPCYASGRTITVQGLMLHSVGCPQPNPLVFVKNWNKASYKNACVHGFIGEDEVHITLPCMEEKGKAMRGWHCASGKKGSGNNTHIGVEMCEPSCIKYTRGSTFTCSDKPKAVAFVEKTTRNAVELFAQLCTFHGLNPLADGVIISHAEGNARGIASAHADPDHLWKQLGMNYSMSQFRKDVAAAMGGAVVVPPPAPPVAPSGSYMVMVTASTLNVRKGPGTGYGVAMQIKNGGVYTIVEESAGWGKLKSGAGWISLAYTKRV